VSKDLKENLKEHFSKASRYCPFHILTKSKLGHRCICSQTKDTCNKYDCPRLHGRGKYQDEGEEEWEE
jgi:hypothetical protein